MRDTTFFKIQLIIAFIVINIIGVPVIHVFRSYYIHLIMFSVGWPPLDCWLYLLMGVTSTFTIYYVYNHHVLGNPSVSDVVAAWGKELSDQYFTMKVLLTELQETVSHQQQLVKEVNQ